MPCIDRDLVVVLVSRILWCRINRHDVKRIAIETATFLGNGRDNLGNSFSNIRVFTRQYPFPSRSPEMDDQDIDEHAEDDVFDDNSYQVGPYTGMRFRSLTNLGMLYLSLQ